MHVHISGELCACVWVRASVSRMCVHVSVEGVHVGAHEWWVYSREGAEGEVLVSEP